MKIGVLGPLIIDGEDRRLNPRDRVVLEALVAAGTGSLTPEQLADALWLDVPPASWVKNLQGCVVRLRKLLGSGAIETREDGYRLTLPADSVDLRRFERLMTRGHELLVLREPERAAYHLAQALELWRGHPLTAIDHWERGSAEARRLEVLRLDAQDWWLEARLASGGHEAVRAQAEAMVGACPTRERRWQMLAMAQYRSGRQADALETLRRARTTLVEELALDPGPELSSIEQGMLRQDPALVVLPEPAATGADSPYPGLAAFDVADTESFFGRDAAVADALDRLRNDGVLVVVGSSGCGKSSFVRAGIAAALERHGQRIAVLAPGAHPLAALADATGSAAGSRIALVVDQAEESFALCPDPDEREAFWSAVARQAERAPVVVAFRADRMGDVAGDPALTRLVERGLFLLGAMTTEELRAAVLEPARRSGLVVEPGLVDLLVREVEGEPGALPLLAHAIRETWRRREGRALTVAAYQEAGGVQGAIAQTAEAVYADIDAHLRPSMRNLMLRLVVLVPDCDPLRTRVPRRQVADVVNTDLVDVLVAARLLTSDADMVTLAHESLARSWPRLRGWLEDDVEGQRILHHLASAADSWDALGRPDSELYRGMRLAKALDWRARTTPSLSALEREFLNVSEDLAQAELRSAQERARHQARINRRLRGVLAVAAVLLLVTTAVGIYALRQTRKAETAADTARHAAVAEQARRIGGHALLAPDISQALLLAVQGVRLDDSPETRVNLLAAMTRQPRLVRSVPGAGDYIDWLQVSADGKRLAIPDDKGGVHLYDAATSSLMQSYQAGEVPQAGSQRWTLVSFSPRDEYLAVGTDVAPPVRLLDPHTLAPTGPSLRVPHETRTQATGIDFSADGRYLAVAMQRTPAGEEWTSHDPSFVSVWDLRSPDLPPHVVPTGAHTQGLALSPDGRTVYTSLPLSAYDVATGRRVWSTEFDSWLLLHISPDGRLLASEVHENDAPVRLTDARTGETLRILRGHEKGPRDVRFSDDGSRLASVSLDGQLIVWQVSTGQPLVTTDTFEVSWSVDFSPDGRRVYTGGDDAALRTWDLYGDQQFLRRMFALPGGEDYVDVEASPDGRRLAYVSRGRSETETSVHFLDTATGRRTHAILHGEADSLGAWHPDGRHYAVLDLSDVVTVLDAQTGETSARRRVLDDVSIFSMAYVDQGERLMVGGSDDRVTFLDADTLLPSGGFPVPSHGHAAGGPGGGTVMVFEDSSDGATETWRIIDTGSGEVLDTGHLDLRASSAAYSPDGEQVAVTGNSGEVVTIDVTSGRVTPSPTTGHAAEGLWVRWSPDGSRIVSGATDGSVSLWDGESLDLLGTVVVPATADPVPVSPTFTADGDVMLASYDGRVYRWDTDLDHALGFACQMAGRNLSSSEWEAALPDLPYEKTCPSNS